VYDFRAKRPRCDTVDPFADLMDSAIELVSDLPVVERFGILATPCARGSILPMRSHP
jgi:hypothetical protein